MKAKVDQILTEFVARFRATVDSTSVTLDEPVRSARQNGFSDPLRGQERPLPIAVGTCTDVRHGIRQTPPLNYVEVYPAEPTTWGLGFEGEGAGFNPPPCVPSAPPTPACAWPPVPRSGMPVPPAPPAPPAPPVPRIVPCRPPQPFRLFDGPQS